MFRLFNLQAVEASLEDFRASFPGINDQVLMRREEITADMVGRIVSAYEFLNSLLRKEMDLFTPAGLHNLLELNHIVLCGTDDHTRDQYYHHVQETRKGFLKKVVPIKEWVLEKRDKSDPWKVATGYYARSLSQPQLFIEGNHRTGNIILNYLLVSRQVQPFVINAANAVSYLDLSTQIKASDKGNTLDSTIKIPGLKKKFHDFLRDNGSNSYLLP